MLQPRRGRLAGALVLGLLLVPSLGAAAVASAASPFSPSSGASPGAGGAPPLPFGLDARDLGAATSAGVAVNPLGERFVAAFDQGALVLTMVDLLGGTAWELRRDRFLPRAVAAMPDGGAGVVGTTWGAEAQPGSEVDLDAVVLAVTRAGEQAWLRVLATQGPDHARAVAVAPNGGHLVVAGSAGSAAFAARFDPDGTPRWSRTFALLAEQRFEGAAMLPDGSAVVAGWTHDGQRNRMLLARLDPLGEVAWRTVAGAQGASLRAHDVTASPTGQVLVAGARASPTRLEAVVGQVDPAGRLRWLRAVDVEPGAVPHRVVADVAGGALLAASAPASDPLGGETLLLARLGDAGQVVWTQRVDDLTPGATAGLALHPSGGFSAAATLAGRVALLRSLDAPARPR